MKKIFFAVAMFVVALAMTGCTKLLLSEPRGNEASEEQVESNVDAVDYSVCGLYNLVYLGSDRNDEDKDGCHTDLIWTNISKTIPLTDGFGSMSITTSEMQI